MFLKIAMVICALFAQVLASPANAEVKQQQKGGDALLVKSGQEMEAINASFPGENEVLVSVHLSRSSGFTDVMNDGMTPFRHDWYFWSITTMRLVCENSCSYVIIEQEYGYDPFEIDIFGVKLSARGHELTMARTSRRQGEWIRPDQYMRGIDTPCYSVSNAREVSHTFVGDLDGQALQGRYAREVSSVKEYGPSPEKCFYGKG
jgi:hypothetical protein